MTIDVEKYRLGLLKIAYELAFLWFGEVFFQQPRQRKCVGLVREKACRGMIVVLDRHDLKSLDLLQQDVSITCDRLAERVCLSPSACRRRGTALRISGVIQRQVAIVDPQALGFTVLNVVLIVLERDSPEEHRAFRSALADWPAITSCLFVTGSVGMCWKCMRERWVTIMTSAKRSPPPIRP